MHLEFRDLDLAFATESPSRPLLQGFSMSLSGIVSMFGPNGSGKSSLVKWLIGHGAEKFRSNHSNAMHQAGASIGYVAQDDDSILDHLNGLDNVALTHVLQGVAWKAARSRVEARVSGLLDGLPMDRRCGQMSGGERRLVMLAREVARDPQRDILFVDEGWAAMDYARRFRAMGWVRDWSRATGTTVLNIGHGAEEVSFLSDRVLILTPRPTRVHSLVEIDGPAVRGIQNLGERWLTLATEGVQQAFREAAST